MDSVKNTEDIYSLKEILHRSARDGGYGGGGGGCGGFEVFGFLAFLLALLDLFLKISDMDDGDGGDDGAGRSLRGRRSSVLDGGTISNNCDVPVNLTSGWWSVGEVGEAVLVAVQEYQECSPGYPCPAAVSLCQRLTDVAKEGPLPRSVVKLTSKWMSKWPSLQGSELAIYSRKAAKGRMCFKNKYKDIKK